MLAAGSPGTLGYCWGLLHLLLLGGIGEGGTARLRRATAELRMKAEFATVEKAGGKGRLELLLGRTVRALLEGYNCFEHRCHTECQATKDKLESA